MNCNVPDCFGVSIRDVEEINYRLCPYNAPANSSIKNIYVLNCGERWLHIMARLQKERKDIAATKNAGKPHPETIWTRWHNGEQYGENRESVLTEMLKESNAIQRNIVAHERRDEKTRFGENIRVRLPLQPRPQNEDNLDKDTENETRENETGEDVNNDVDNNEEAGGSQEKALIANFDEANDEKFKDAEYIGGIRQWASMHSFKPHFDVDMDIEYFLEELKKVSLRQEQAFRLWIFENCAYELIAQEMRISKGAARSLVSDARKNVEKIMKNAEWFPL